MGTCASHGATVPSLAHPPRWRCFIFCSKAVRGSLPRKFAVRALRCKQGRTACAPPSSPLCPASLPPRRAPPPRPAQPPTLPTRHRCSTRPSSALSPATRRCPSSGCEQYLAYAAEAAEAAEAAGRAGKGTAGLEAPCRDFLSYLEQLRSAAKAGEALEATTTAAATAATTATTAATAASSAGPGGPPSEVVAQQGVQWYSAADAAETVARLRSDPLPYSSP